MFNNIFRNADRRPDAPFEQSFSMYSDTPVLNEFFDVVIDRAAIQHNTYKNAKQIVSEVYRVLKPKGLFYSSLTSDNHCLFGKGKYLGNGDYLNEAHDGVRHFYSRSEIIEIFSNFEIIKWYHMTRQELPSNEVTNGVYHLEMIKG